MDQLERPDGRTRWIGGYPVVSERALTPEETHQLEREAANLRRNRRSWLALALAGAPLMLLAALGLLSGTSNSINFIGFFLVLLGMAFLAIGPLAARDCSRAISRHEEQIRYGRVGLIDLKVFDEDDGESQSGGSSTNDVDMESSERFIEVFPTTGFAALPRAKDAQRNIAFTTARLAAVPVSVRMGPPQLVEDRGRVLSTRRMSPPERKELLDYSSRLSRRPQLWQPIAWTTWLSVGFLSLFAGRVQGASLITLGALFLVSAMNWWLWIKHALTRRSIASDLTIGMVAEVTVDAAAWEGPGPCPLVAEYLTRSGLVWTVDGLPATWRRLGI